MLGRVAAVLTLALLLSSSTPAAAMPIGIRAGIGRPTPPLEPQLTGYAFPVDEPLRLDADLLPGSPRDYRGGTHEGIDFPAPYGAPVRAARPGVVVRVDRDYVEWSSRQRATALAFAVREHATPADVLNELRGRQIWIDHGDGVVTRYAHLSAVADLHVGEAVAEGEVIGEVGSSGLPEGGPHLHFEIRVGDGYLGRGDDPDEVRYLLARAFSEERWTRGE